MNILNEVLNWLLNPLLKLPIFERFFESKYRRVFFVRFTGYFLVMVGVLMTGLMLEPVIGEEARFNYNQFIGRKYTVPNIVTNTEAHPNGGQPSTKLGDLKDIGGDIIAPVSTDYGIVIEKINANAKVVPDVDPGNESAYTEALKIGVAHAKGTVNPGQKGNIFLFSHSTDAPWNVVRYNAIFFLLNKLERGDRVVMFYQGKRFDYTVFDKVVAKPTDIQYLTNTYDQSILTLQTCDPPGTTINRLIVRAKLSAESDPSI